MDKNGLKLQFSKVNNQKIDIKDILIVKQKENEQAIQEEPQSWKLTEHSHQINA